MTRDAGLRRCARPGPKQFLMKSSLSLMRRKKQLRKAGRRYRSRQSGKRFRKPNCSPGMLYKRQRRRMSSQVLAPAPGEISRTRRVRRTSSIAIAGRTAYIPPMPKFEFCLSIPGAATAWFKERKARGWNAARGGLTIRSFQRHGWRNLPPVICRPWNSCTAEALCGKFSGEGDFLPMASPDEKSIG